MNEASRKDKQEATQQTVKFFENVLRASSDGIVITDSAQNIIVANDYFCSLFGTTIQEVKETNLLVWLEKLGLEEPKKWAQIERTTHSEGKCENIEFQFPPELGARVQSVNASLLEKVLAEERGVIISIWRDITERRKAEEEKNKLEAQLRQATKMQAVGTLAGGIAHEFNNMLAVIMGYTDLALHEVPQDSFARTALDRVMEASFQVENLVKQILTFSRKSHQQRISANLCPLVKESVKFIQPSIPSSVEIQTNIDPDCGNTKVDPTEIQQIIMNLCSNAVLAMKENGTLKIRQKEVHLTNHDELIPKGLSAGRYVKLSFSDTGGGIDQETLPRIFDPFFTTKEVGRGTGMGLSIIYAIMESYGGAITVESEVGKGTTFHLYFRVTDERAVLKQEQVEATPRGSERILFVDDEEMYAKLGKEILSHLGYDVDLKINSGEALEVFKAAPDNYDLVITDQVMPYLSGEELVKEIRTIRPDVPIILCTGYSTQMDEKKARSLGINEFAFKPILMKDLAKLIRKVLDAS
ncbi:MAG: ATP-binding protein [Desulfobulbaceae bacterium]|nr:ATP-binding protein [Desulfobulbaceae bacterium]